MKCHEIKWHWTKEDRRRLECAQESAAKAQEQLDKAKAVAKEFEAEGIVSRESRTQNNYGRAIQYAFSRKQVKPKES